MSFAAFSGIDVGLDSLVLITTDADLAPGKPLTFANDKLGRNKLVRHLLKLAQPVHVCLEPTSNYHLELALLLHATDAIKLSVVNPRAVRDFARSKMQRAKTDACDAQVLSWYAAAHQPHAWQPPRQIDLELRTISRRLDDLTARLTAVKNRLHSARHGRAPACVLDDLRSERRAIDGRLKKLRQAALGLIRTDTRMSRRLEQLLSTKGIGEVSGIRLLAEVGTLPDGLGKNQWVAGAGLDPEPHESGKSVKGRRRISKQGNKHLRRALNMPALVATKHCPEVREYYEKLQRRGVVKMAALCAVMRKLLQAIWGMFNSDTLFNPSLFCQSKH